MGLVPAFVFSVNRRALLAVLAIGVSVSYALVAGAAVGGLNEAQTALAGELSQTRFVVEDADGEPFDLTAVDPAPDRAIAATSTTNHTVYSVRAGEPAVTNASHALAGPSSSLDPGGWVWVAGHNLTVVGGAPPAGAQAGWLGVHASVFADAGGVEAPNAHVAAFEEPSDALMEKLEAQGLAVHEVPGAFPYYTDGSLQLVSAVRVAVVASALVVALLTSTIVSLELRAKRASFSTLQVYAGRNLVRGLVAGRGATILAAGHAIGIGVTLGAVFLLGRTGAIDLALPTDYVVTALAATGGGGLLGLVQPVWKAGRPLRAAELGEQTQPRAIPRPLRLTLTSWRTVIPLAISAAILAGSLGVIFGAVDMPNQLFGVDDASVIADTRNNPLRGTAPAFLGKHLGQVDGFTGSSPEIFAPTRVNGHPIMVRGVDWPALQTMEPVHIVEGEAMDAPGEAVLGARAAARLGADVGDTLAVPSAYLSSVEHVEIVGVATAPGLLGDEVLVPLETARAITGVRDGDANMVRYTVSPGFFANRTGGPVFPTGLEATELTVEPKEPIPLATANATVDLVNFADSPESRHLTLRVNGQPIADAWVDVPAKATGQATLSFRVPQAGLLALQVNPSEEVRTGEPAYRIQTPPAVTTDATAELAVTDASSGDPASDVRVRVLDQRATTGPDGTASFQVTRAGNHSVTAEGPEGQGATTLLVVAPEDLYRGHVAFHSLSGPATVDDGSWPAIAMVENIGAETFDGTLTVPVDGQPTNATDLTLASGRTARVSFTLELPNGVHQIGPEGASTTVSVTGGAPADDGADGGTGGDDGDQTGGFDDDGDDGQDDDGSDAGGEGPSGDAGTGEDGEDIRELLQRRAQTRRGASGPEEVEPIQAFLGDTFENFNTAVTVVTIATVLHAGLIGLVAVRRDVEENAGTLGTLASVGADRGELRRHAIQEFLLVGGVATVLGTLLGLGLVHWAAGQGLVAGFGHALVPRTSLDFALRVGAVSLAVVLAAAILAVEQTRGRRLTTLMTQGPVRSARPPLSRLIGGDHGS